MAEKGKGGVDLWVSPRRKGGRKGGREEEREVGAAGGGRAPTREGQGRRAGDPAWPPALGLGGRGEHARGVAGGRKGTKKGGPNE